MSVTHGAGDRRVPSPAMLLAVLGVVLTIVFTLADATLTEH